MVARQGWAKVCAEVDRWQVVNVVSGVDEIKRTLRLAYPGALDETAAEGDVPRSWAHALGALEYLENEQAVQP